MPKHIYSPRYKTRYHMIPFLFTCKPDEIVLHVGCNIVTKRNNQSIDLNRIAEEIIELDNICKQYCVNDIKIIRKILQKL